MRPPTISLSAGDQSLHIYLPEGELRAYDIPVTFRAASGHFHGETTYTLGRDQRSQLTARIPSRT